MTQDQFLKKLGTHIAQMREQAGLSQTELALRCDKDRQSLNRLEKGRTNPTIISLLTIAKELKISLAELVSLDQ